MNWLNIEISTLRSAAYVGSEPTERATWLNVVAYCADQENGGLIVGAKQWKDRQWQQTCGVTLDEITAAARLLSWIGDDLSVWNYPLDAERTVRARRESGKKGGQSKSELKAEAARTNGAKHNPSKAQADAKHNPSTDPTEGNGKEGKEKKEEGKAAPAAVAFPSALETPAFRAAWTDYLDYRRERRLAKLLPKSEGAQLARLAGWGHDAAILSIRDTIAQQWQGLFEPKSKPGSAGAQRPAEAPRYSDEFIEQLAREKPELFRELYREWPTIQRQANRLGIKPV